jgi:hypothetical protein
MTIHEFIEKMTRGFEDFKRDVAEHNYLNLEITTNLDEEKWWEIYQLFVEQHGVGGNS